MLNKLMLISLLFFIGPSHKTTLATCQGKSPCNACKNCKYCKHCAKNGGTCGVCK